MDNGMENMLDMYLFETNSLLERLDELLLDAEKNGNFSTDDVDEIFRIMHTIKGSSAMMEFSSLMTVAHRIEDLFFFIRENTVDAIDDEHKHQIFDLMFRATDHIRDGVSKLENNEPLSNDIDSIVQDINTLLNKISASKNGNPAQAEENGSKVHDNVQFSKTIKEPSFLPADSAPYYLVVFFDIGCGMENLRAFMLATAIGEVCEDFKIYPEVLENNPESASEIIEKGFILSFQDRDDLERAVSVVKNSGNVQTYEIFEQPDASAEEDLEFNAMPEHEIIEDPAISAATSNIAAKKPVADKVNALQAPQAHNAGSKQSLISVNLTKLNKLMAIVGEIVITESMVTSSPDIQGIKLDNFTKSARQLRKLTDELQDISMSIRMVPISGVFQKMNRIVRDMGQKLGKDVRLTIVGAETEVDKTIVDGIGDPIMHIVRNSMDHGIEENAQDRTDNGKPAQGEIILSAEHTGSEVVITVTDDGKGIDPEKILTKARNNGILTKAESEYSQKEILSLLMAAGFSTNENVTEYSGRGVGMDVVRKNVEQIGGTVYITSTLGEGMSTVMKIPLTLAIVDGMEISVGKSIFTVPINNIRQSFKVSADEVIYDAASGELVKRMDNFYPIIRLHSLYNIDTQITNIEDGILVWVESGDKSYCLFVDELMGEQQVVVKPIPVYLNSFNIKNSGIAGCTILGDGNISIILDISNLYAVTSNMY